MKKALLTGVGRCLKKGFFLSLLSLFVLSHIGFGQVSWKKFDYFQNLGGLNDNLSTTEISDNESTSIQNVVFDSGGTITKRYGFYNIISTSGAPTFKLDPNATGVTGLSYFRTSNGNQYLVAIANVNGTAEAWSKTLGSNNSVPIGSWTRIDNSLLPNANTYTNDKLVSFAIANDNLVITMGSTGSIPKPFTWTGSGNITALTADVNVKPSTICVFHKNILFLAGDSNNPSRVTFSDLTNGITTYVATDFFDLDKNNGQYITGMVSAFGNLYIFENNSIWILTGTSRDDFYLQKMVDNVGTTSPQSISIVNNTIFFVTSQNDIAAYDGNFGVQFVSSKIRNTISNNNLLRTAQAIGIGFSSYRNKDLDYYVSESTASSGNNNQVLLFDTYRQAWTIFQGMNVNAWTVMPSGTGLNEIVFGDYGGLVYLYPNISNYSDVSNSCTSANVCTTTSPAIYAYYQTKWFRYPEVSLGDKYLKVVNTYVSNSLGISNTLSMEVRSDYATSGTIYTFSYTNSGSLWDTAIWDKSTWPGGSLNVNRQEVNIGTKMFQIKYSNNNAGEPMVILGYENYVEPTNQI